MEGLKFNLISVSQLCDKGMKVTFAKTHCDVVKLIDNMFSKQEGRKTPMC